MISNRIGESCAGLIMHQISYVLASEFASQISLGNDFLPAEVATDYIKAIDAATLPFVGVMYSDSDYPSEAQSQSDAVSKYVIECKAKSYSDARKISEVVRAILKNTRYNKLSLSADFGIKGTKVLSKNMSVFEQRRSSQDNTTAFVIFEVRHYETTERVEGIPLVRNNTKAVVDNEILYYTTNLS